MPANLTPEYERAERRYRQAANDEERLAALHEMLSAIPRHKGTEKMQAELKRRISQLRQEGQRTTHSKGPDPFHIPRGGAGQVVLSGPPNSGKSSLLAATTHADAKVADYPFTTVVPQPGMWHHEDVPLELVDTPPLTAEHVPSGLMGTIRNADVVCLVVEAGESGLEQAREMREVLRARGLELSATPRPRHSSPDAALKPSLLALNKADLVSVADLQTLRELYSGEGALEVVPVSARTRQGLDDLFKHLWGLLGMLRVYAKEPGRPPDMHKPFILPLGATVEDLARQIHRDLPERMKFARLWGHSRFEGQQVHRTEPLRDKDIVEIHE